MPHGWAAAPRPTEAYMAPGPGAGGKSSSPCDGSRENEYLREPASLGREAGKSPPAGGHGRQGGPGDVGPGPSSSPSPRCSHCIQPLPSCSSRAGGLAGRLAGQPAGVVPTPPPPSGSDIIPLSPRRSRSTDSGKQEGWRAREPHHGVARNGGLGLPGAGAPVLCL